MREKRVGDIIRHPDYDNFFANSGIDSNNWVGVITESAESSGDCKLGECRVIWIDQGMAGDHHYCSYLAADLLIYCPGYSLGGI